MIQRIQSVYILLTSLTPLLFLRGAILKFTDMSGSEYDLGITGLQQLSDEGKILLIDKEFVLPVLLVLIFILSIISLFSYKNRKAQARFVVSVIIAGVVLTGYIAFLALSYSGHYNLAFKPVPALIFPLLIILFSYLALRGIKKDEGLVRSYDRLR